MSKKEILLPPYRLSALCISGKLAGGVFLSI